VPPPPPARPAPAARARRARPPPTAAPPAPRGSVRWAYEVIAPAVVGAVLLVVVGATG
ncbi:PH domain-containing protein, partial [Streptomyces anulatus]